MRGTTSTGFEYQVNDQIKKDYRFVRAYKRMSKPRGDEEAITAVDDFMEAVLGEEGVTRLMEHVKDESGFVSIERMIKEVGEILKHVSNQEKELKNFFSSQTS